MRLSDKKIQELILDDETVQKRLAKLIEIIQQCGCVSTEGCEEAVGLCQAIDEACYKWNHHEEESEGLDK